MFERDLLNERARLTPDRLALVEVATGLRLTYADLDARADRAAAAISDHGVAAGDRVGILALNSVDYLAFFFGGGRAGIVVVPLSTRATSHELKQIADDCQMRAVYYGDDFRDLVSDWDIPRHPLVDSQTATPKQAPRNLERDPESIACLLYTSGTTGRPKGVMIPWRQLLWNGYNTALCWDLRADDVSPVFTPLCHAGGLAAFLIPIFCAGGTIVLHKSFDTTQVWETIQRERCTVVLGVPTIWRLLSETPEFETADLRHVRWFISGGAPLPASLIDLYQKRGVVMKQGYGLTEVGVNCFSMTSEDALLKRGSIGKPMLFTEARLVGEGGDDVDEGEIGELYFRGPHVSAGYWRNEQATADAYLPGGWFRTGDLARKDAEGFYYIAGRRKEMFISGGLNVYPAEIERELLSHPLVKDAAILPVPDPDWGEAAVAFVVCEVETEVLRDYLAARLSRYKLPRTYIRLESLPRTPYGKIVREELRRLYGAELKIEN